MQQNWFETWFESPYYDVLYQHRDDKEAAQFIDNLLEYLKPRPNDSILDLACGNGRHSIYLAKKGFEVVGIDLSQKSIDQARHFETDNLSFYTHDMRNLFRVNYFDYVFNFFTSLGYFEKEHDNVRALQTAYTALKQNGVLVIDFLNKQWVLDHLVTEQTKLLKGIEFQLKKSYQNGFIIKDIRIKDGDTQKHFREKVQMLTLDDFRRLLTTVGFSIESIFGSYQLEPYNEKESNRLIIVARKND